jgi:hypothetical protein
MIHSFFFIFMTLVFTLSVFAIGYSVGYDSAIDDMKKVRNRK